MGDSGLPGQPGRNESGEEEIPLTLQVALALMVHQADLEQHPMLRAYRKGNQCFSEEIAK